MTKKLRLLAVTFDVHIESWELPRFRMDLSNLINPNEEWFHAENQDDDNPIVERYFYRYKLLQYKCLFNNPMIIFAENAIDEVQKFFSNPYWHDLMNCPFPVKKIDQREYDMHTNNVRTYRIYNWMPLSGDDYRRYQTLRGLAAKLDFLQPKLAAHILSFADGIHWHLNDAIFVNILELFEDRFVSFKGQKMLTFNFSFECNVPLPDMLGLGRGILYGFGVVRPYALNKSK